MRLLDLLDDAELSAALDAGYVRVQYHPDEPLGILNYTERCAFDGAWNRTTMQCRGVIFRTGVGLSEVVARPFPKFFNYGEPNAPADLPLDSPVIVSDKVDGSLGILYPRAGGGYGVATRGSFTSEQALHATHVWEERYQGRWLPLYGVTHLFEIVYPENRIILDYDGLDDLVHLDAIENATGWHVPSAEWIGPTVETHPYETLEAALRAEPRPNREGLVVYFPETNERVKIKQADYVALHRIVTRTNARNVWEVAAVHACRELLAGALVEKPHYWGTYLGIDPARAAEVLELGDDWLERAGIPDEFYGWVERTIDDVTERAGQLIVKGISVAERASRIEDRAARYVFVNGQAGAAVTEVMRLASSPPEVDDAMLRLDELRLKAWRLSCPEPTAPFARSEDVA